MPTAGVVSTQQIDVSGFRTWIQSKLGAEVDQAARRQLGVDANTRVSLELCFVFAPKEREIIDGLMADPTVLAEAGKIEEAMTELAGTWGVCKVYDMKQTLLANLRARLAQ